MSQLLAKRVSNPLSPSLTAKICTLSGGTSKNFVQLVNVAYNNQIRNSDQELVKKRLAIELPVIAMQYGATKDLPKSILLECVKLIFKKYSYLAVGEIREAYMNWATEETYNRMYGGIFSAGQLGEVLRVYSQKRRKTLAAILRVKDEEQRNAMEEKKRADGKAAFDAAFPKLLLEGKANFKSWKEVPEYWYKICLEKGMIQFSPGEGQAILGRSKQLLAEQEEADRQLGKFDPFAKRNQKEAAQRIARKLTVFEKVLQPNDDIGI